MKKFAVLVMAVFAIALVANTAMAGKDSKDAAGAQISSSSGKVGFVDLNRVLNEVNEGKAARAKLEADGKAKKQKLEMMQNDLKRMKEDLDKQRLILSADAMRAKESEFQQKFVELQKTSMEFEKEFGEKEAAAIKPISDKIQRTIQSIGASDGYTMIVPREMALYTPAGSDLTDKVIASYNAGK